MSEEFDLEECKEMLYDAIRSSVRVDAKEDFMRGVINSLEDLIELSKDYGIYAYYPGDYIGAVKLYEMWEGYGLEHLGEKIKAVRLARGMTQQKLADAVKCTKGTIFKWESGSTAPSLELFKDVANVLGMPYQFFLDD